MSAASGLVTHLSMKVKTAGKVSTENNMSPRKEIRVSPSVMLCYAFFALLRSKTSSASAARATARYIGRLEWSPVSTPSHT